MLRRRVPTRNFPSAGRQAARRDRASKFGPFKPAITELLQQDSTANAPVIVQRLQPLGYDGGVTITQWIDT